MLNTDLHKVQKKKTIKKMSKEAFCNNLRGADQNEDIDHDLLSRIYDSIQSHPIELSIENAELKQSNPATSTTTTTQGVGEMDEKSFLKDVNRGLRDAEDLLRSLSNYTYRFQLTGVDTNMSMDLVSFMYETVWFHFHAITESLLASSSSVDMNVTFSGSSAS